MESYETLSEIGKGMGGVVYLARDKATGEFKVRWFLHLERVTDLRTDFYFLLLEAS